MIRKPNHTLYSYLPLLLFLAPVISVNLAYLIASWLDHVPACVTYLSGCASISSTGRVMPQKGIFLIGMVPTAVLSLIFWMSAEKWLSEHKMTLDEADRTLAITGAIASLFLLVYVCTLGIPGKYYSLTRKFAVLIYFGFTFIAQLLLVRKLVGAGDEKSDDALSRLGSRLKYYCAFVIACGMTIIPISLIEDPIIRKRIENILEWNFALFLYLFFLLVYFVWKHRGPDRTLVTERDLPT